MKKEVILILTAILLTSQTLAFEFCDEGVTGENNLRLISINDMLKENTKEWIWESLQKIELEARVENKNEESGDYILEAIFKDGDDTVKIAEDSDDLEKKFSLSPGERKSISLEFETKEDLDPENYDLYIKFYKEKEEDKECTENSEKQISIEKIEICEDEKVDEDELEINYIKDEKDENENEWEWTPMDNIEISLEVENKDYSKREFTTELIFLDKNNKEVFLADNSDDLIEKEEIDEGDLEEISFNFQIKSDMEEGIYTLYAKTYDSDDSDICTSLKAEKKSAAKTIKISKLERKVIITSVEGPTELETSSKAEYSAKIINLGSENEEKVMAIIYNRQLNILQRVELNELESGEEKELSFQITIPENASESSYTLLFSTEYDYKESKEIFREFSSENEDIKHSITITKKKEEINKTESSEIKENQTIEEEINKTTEEENQTKSPSTVITGNVIGTKEKSPSWIMIIILLGLLATGIFFFIKKPKLKKTKNPEPPKVIRRYTAKL